MGGETFEKHREMERRKREWDIARHQVEINRREAIKANLKNPVPDLDKPAPAAYHTFDTWKEYYDKIKKTTGGTKSNHINFRQRFRSLFSLPTRPNQALREGSRVVQQGQSEGWQDT